MNKHAHTQVDKVDLMDDMCRNGLKTRQTTDGNLKQGAGVGKPGDDPAESDERTRSAMLLMVVVDRRCLFMQLGLNGGINEIREMDGKQRTRKKVHT